MQALQQLQQQLFQASAAPAVRQHPQRQPSSGSFRRKASTHPNHPVLITKPPSWAGADWHPRNSIQQGSGTGVFLPPAMRPPALCVDSAGAAPACPQATLAEAKEAVNGALTNRSQTPLSPNTCGQSSCWTSECGSSIVGNDFLYMSMDSMDGSSRASGGLRQGCTRGPGLTCLGRDRAEMDDMLCSASISCQLGRGGQSALVNCRLGRGG